MLFIFYILMLWFLGPLTTLKGLPLPESILIPTDSKQLAFGVCLWYSNQPIQIPYTQPPPVSGFHTLDHCPPALLIPGTRQLKTYVPVFPLPLSSDQP